MDDLIRRQDVIDYVLEHGFYCDTEADKEYTAELIRTVFPSAQQWIPCSERLPEKHKTVLITHRGGVSFGWRNGKHWERGASQNHRPLQTVIAWMPLPEPYKEDDDG